VINLIECNIVIPIITTVNKGDDIDKIIHHYAMKYAIAPSHIIVVQPKKDELTVDQIHLMQKDIQVAFSQLVLVVLREVDNSSNEVQNSLLKCLEEDANRIVFLLLVKNPARLLSTIRSRCMVIDYKPAAGKLKLAKDYTEDYTKVFSFAKNSEVSKEISIERIDQFILSSPSLKTLKALHYLLQTRKLIMDNNMNPVLALDSILLFLSKASNMKVLHEKEK